MSGKVPRVVIVTRPTEYELLVVRHATREQAEFFLKTRGQKLEDVEKAFTKHQEVLKAAMNAIPVQWRRNLILRQDLDRFLFEPEDIVVVVGQDGLVANAAKYLDGQSVIGVNPDPAAYDGVLVPHPVKSLKSLLTAASQRRVELQARVMVEAGLDDGQRLLALNEVFLGHCTHQSARYRLQFQKHEERQSSSGLIVATGTGATGWARSINTQRDEKLRLPKPEQPTLAFFVREAFPSVSTGTDVTEGLLEMGQVLTIVSEMNDGGILFGDGIEADHLEFKWGMKAEIRVAEKKLQLVLA